MDTCHWKEEKHGTNKTGRIIWTMEALDTHKTGKYFMAQRRTWYRKTQYFMD